MIKSITLLGSSSGRNAGDAALMAGIMESVDSACGTQMLYEIPTICPSFVKNNYRTRVKPLALYPWNLSIKFLGLPVYNSIMRTDLSVVFDAVLFDRSLYNPLFNFLHTFSLFFPAAKRRGKKLGFFNVGAGPVNTPVGRRMLADVAELMDFITVRDQDSYDLFRDIGVKNPRMMLTADAALNVVACSNDRTKEIFREIDLDPSDPILAININKYIDTWAGVGTTPLDKQEFLSTYATAINKTVEKLKVPVLFVVTQHHDLDITQDLMSRINSNAPVKLIDNIRYNQYEIKGVLGKVALLFAMRLHAMILATAEHTPTVGLAYQPKCNYYYNSLGMPDRMLTFKQFSVNSLTDHMMRAWEDRHEIKAQLQTVIPHLQQQAHNAGLLVAAIHRGEDLDKVFESMTQTQMKQRAGASTY